MNRSYLSGIFQVILFISISFSCTEIGDVDPDNPSEPQTELDFEYTYSDVKQGYTMDIDGETVSDVAETLNSLESNRALIVNFSRGNDFLFGGISWIPLKAGDYETGYNLGQGQGTLGNDLFMVAFVKKDGVKYYAYSSHEYGFNEDRKIPGSFCKVKIRTLEGKQTSYRIFGQTVSQFIGVVEGQFAGTFKTPDGREVKVTNGQFRIENTIPDGAEVLN